MNIIQGVRKELNEIINSRVKPLRQQLDNLLNAEAVKLCPFVVGDIITLDNGKKGSITGIKYLSNDYSFIDSFDAASISGDGADYVYAYSVDNEKFSITWVINGLRMNSDGKIGKISFSDISPLAYNIDKANKSVKRKGFSDMLGAGDYSIFDNLDS